MGRRSAKPPWRRTWGRLSRPLGRDQRLVLWAQARGLEKGQRIRVDATAVQTNIHYPLDSELLYDHSSHPGGSCGSGKGSASSITRGGPMNIRNRRGKKAWTVTAIPCGYLARPQWSDPLSLVGAAQLAHYLELLHKVIQRRVLSGEASRPRRRSVRSSKSTPIFSSPRDGLRPQGVC